VLQIEIGNSRHNCSCIVRYSISATQNRLLVIGVSVGTGGFLLIIIIIIIVLVVVCCKRRRRSKPPDSPGTAGQLQCVIFEQIFLQHQNWLS